MGERGGVNYFMISFHESYMAELGFELATLGSAVRRATACAIDRAEGQNYSIICTKKKSTKCTILSSWFIFLFKRNLLGGWLVKRSKGLLHGIGNLHWFLPTLGIG